jgi:hypothetical protein
MEIQIARDNIPRWGKTKRVTVSPKIEPNDLFFATWHFKSETPTKTTYIYNGFVRQFAELLERIGKGEREDNSTRHKLTLHSFRRFVKTTISDLGHQDYSDWFLGHAGSTYWRKSDKEKLEMFAKIDLLLTYMDVVAIERHHADMDLRIESLQKDNEQLRRMVDTIYPRWKKFMDEYEKKEGI